MSWLAQVGFSQQASASEIGEAIDALISQGQQGAEVNEQLAVAKQAAKQIVLSGAIGVGGYLITLSGHANPKHEPTEGYANDFISVTISQNNR